MVINLRMIPQLITLPEKQINKTKKQEETPLTLNAPFYSSPLPHFHCFNKFAVIFSGIKITACFSISLEQQLIGVIVSVCLFLKRLFLSVFHISFSLSSSLYTSLVQKEQYFSPMHSSVHYSLSVNPSFCFGYKLPRRQESFPSLTIPDLHPVSVSTKFISLFEYIFLLFHELSIKPLSSVGCSVLIFTTLPEESMKDSCPKHFGINASFHYVLKKIHLS